MKKFKKLVIFLIGAVLMGTMLVACGASKLEGTYKGDGKPIEEITFEEDGTVIITESDGFSYIVSWERDGDTIQVYDWHETKFKFENGQLKRENLDGSLTDFEKE